MDKVLTSANKKISFVIPCYYSEKTLGGVVEQIIASFPTQKYRIEIVLVNDGSTDGTYEVICELAKTYDFIKGVNLLRNFGQDSALMAGYSFCTGDYIVCLDDDQQNPPMEAHKLIATLEEGNFDVVFGKYRVKKDSRFKNFGSWLNDKMANCLIQKPKDVRLCSYFVMTSQIKDEILRYHGAFPYVWGLILRSTTRISNEYIEHKAREVGTTTYTLRKLIRYWLNGFTAFSIKPLRLVALLGCLLGAIGLVFSIIIVIEKLAVGIDVEGWTSLICVIMILSGTQLGVLGMLGEYIGRMYMNMNNAPLYIVRDTITKDGSIKRS